MKRSVVLLLVIGLLAGALTVPAEAAKKKKKKKKAQRVERVVEVDYQAPAIGISPPGTGVCLRPTNSCGDIVIGAGELYAKVEITDATGTPVAFSLGQDTDPDTVGTEHDLGQFCGTTGDDPVALEPGFAIVVFPWALGPACGAVATQGTVKATLSNLP